MEKKNKKPNTYLTTSRTKQLMSDIENSFMEINFANSEELLQTAIDTFSGNMYGQGIFTDEDAEAYVIGENEISELLKEAKKNRGFIETIFYPKKYEREIRAEYEKDHPEYANAAKDGDKLRNDYEQARSIAEKTWLENNPQPTEKYKKGSGLFGFSQTEEFKEWINKREEALKEFENEYRYNNPDYDNLVIAQIKNQPLTEIPLGNL